MWKFSFQDQRVHTIEKKTMWNIFSIFAVKYSSTKELLHKPSEIQSNITGTLLAKLNIIFFFLGGGGFILQDITPWNNKNVRNCYFLGTLGAWEPMWNSMVFYDFVNFTSFSLYHLGKNSFNFELGFFTHFKYISGGIIRKNILHSDYHSARWYWCKKDQKNPPKTLHKICSHYLIVTSSFLWAFVVENIWKNSFSGGKSWKNGIPVIKITFSLQIIPQNYRFPWLNTKTIKYTCRFNTL